MNTLPRSIDTLRPTETLTSVEITWLLPEVEWHDAIVTLTDPTSPSGLPVASWQIDALYDGRAFSPTWSSGTDRRMVDHGDGRGCRQHQARIRVPRHDGPCLVAVRVYDSGGERFDSVLSQNRR